ncbi:MAG: NusG domain II-containing protein [Firmicutes bacterium]|nr:NusG domain II-containing protein [Bacillota bacterium]
MKIKSSSSESRSAAMTMFRPADIILAVGLIVIGFAMSFFLAFGKDDGAQVTVRTGGELYGVYSLDEDQTVTIKQGSRENEFEIRDGTVRMLHANCHNHDCIQQGSISRTGETIVCLPNKVVLEITGGEEAFDVVAQ